MDETPPIRARDLGITIGTLPTGRHNAITDVAGVRVGHSTLITGEGPLVRGQGPVRTGVTIVEPRRDLPRDPIFAGFHRLNGNGELTGTHWIRETGALTTPIGLTNSHSVGVVRDAIAAHLAQGRPSQDLFWLLPVVGETWDGILNDINGQHVRPEHVAAAFAAASDGPVGEGCVGGGTGMICYEFKGGIGTSSRMVTLSGPEQTERHYTVGVLVQANHGRRARLRIDGQPVGELIGHDAQAGPYPEAAAVAGAGSIIVVVATDAPLIPVQCDRLAQRAALGIGRGGGTGENSSGDLILSFATGNYGLPPVGLLGDQPEETTIRMVSNAVMDRLFDATVEATEEAVVNALVAASTMTGRDGLTAHAIDHGLLTAAMGLAHTDTRPNATARPAGRK
ncbi:MAG: P1 family peptidase [Actinomycetales bacterium]